jgi:hypothetical protein
MAAADEKVVEMHLPLLDELIIFHLANCSHPLLANHHATQQYPPARIDFRLREAGSTADDRSR